MKFIALMDTSAASYNHGDQIIMESARKALAPLTDNSFVVDMPTHTPLFHRYGFSLRHPEMDYNRKALDMFDYKFVCGTNLLWSNMKLRAPQWNLNLFDLNYFRDFILVGVGAGGSCQGPDNRYTLDFYRKALNKDVYHSVRDETAKLFLESMGFKALNTGCVTLWGMDEAHCRNIPSVKSETVVFTITDYNRDAEKDSEMIRTIVSLYDYVYFWPQGIFDLSYLRELVDEGTYEKIRIINPSLDSYNDFLMNNDCDYVGTRLHGGIKAMQCGRRSIIIAIDNRAEGIKDDFNLNCIRRKEISGLRDYILSDFHTDLRLHRKEIDTFLGQFYER